jgi:hypothetical protein
VEIRMGPMASAYQAHPASVQAIFFRRRHQPRRPPIFRVMIALNYPWR